MQPQKDATAGAKPAILTVLNPAGNRSRVPVETLPFQIGRHADNQLVLRDNRISREHARIVSHDGGYAVEDLKSRHGVYVNGERITEPRPLHNGDRIDFGQADSYRLTFTFQEEELSRILDQLHPAPSTQPPTSNLGKLRALLEVARALQSSLSTHDVLTAVVDAALTVTSAERGFLLLHRNSELEISVARDRRGSPLAVTDLKVPMSVIRKALRQRRELLHMSFDPFEEQGLRPDTSVAGLELRSVVCVPLIRIRSANTEETSMVSAANDTVGVLYMDSRSTHADLSHGNRELLQTLALEASTILENARLLEEERTKQHLEEQLGIARQIQMGLLPGVLPTEGWFRAAGSSEPSDEVGGDYFDVKEILPGTWSTVVADVSGKGVSSALLASLLQGAFLVGGVTPAQIEQTMQRINAYLLERTKGEKYATVFYSTLSQAGVLQWCNAGHCAPVIVHRDGRLKTLPTTALPIGMLELATYTVESATLNPGDKVVVYSDGVTEAQNPEGAFFGNDRLRDLLRANSDVAAPELHKRILAAIEAHSEGIPASDDVTLVVLEYAGGE